MEEGRYIIPWHLPFRMRIAYSSSTRTQALRITSVTFLNAKISRVNKTAYLYNTVQYFVYLLIDLSWVLGVFRVRFHLAGAGFSMVNHQTYSAYKSVL
jgi:hypothetical protein